MITFKKIVRAAYNGVMGFWSNPALHSTFHSANTNARLIKSLGLDGKTIKQAIGPVTRVGGTNNIYCAPLRDYYYGVINRDKSIKTGRGIESGRNISEDPQKEIEASRNFYKYNNSSTNRYIFSRAWDKLINWLRGK